MTDTPKRKPEGSLPLEGQPPAKKARIEASSMEDDESSSSSSKQEGAPVQNLEEATRIVEIIHHEPCCFPGRRNGKFAWIRKSADQVESEVLAAHPGVYTCQVCIEWPRTNRRILWADPALISRDDFDATCKKERDRIADMCDY